MKATLTLIFVLIFGAIALGNTESYVKVSVIEVGVVLGGSPYMPDTASQVEVGTENRLARLYKFKNSRVKKALSFVTRSNKAKLV